MRFIRNTSGGAATVFALILPIALGLCALVIDVANLRYNKAQLQLAADAGALAGADNINNQQTAVANAVALATMNAPQGAPNIATASDVDLGIYDASTRSFQVTSNNPSAVRVRTARDDLHRNSIPPNFANIFGQAGGNAVRATSIAVASPNLCHYILDPTASGAVQFIGGVSITSNCGMQINSRSSASIATLGLYYVSISKICDVGSYVSLGLGTFAPAPVTGCAAKADPLAGIPEPSPFAVCRNANVVVLGGTLNPGCYTGTITIMGSVNLNPGTYQLQKASMNLIGGSMLRGSEVLLYFDSSSSFTMAGLASLDLTAPSSGAYQGIVIFFSRSNANSNLNFIGGSLLSLNGTVYAPATNLTLTGLNAVSASYGYIIVNRLIATGVGLVKLNAFSSGSRKPPALASRSKLVQ